MTCCKIIISCMFLFTMIGFEVLNNVSVFQEMNSVEISDLEDLTEKYRAEREGESTIESEQKLELNYQELREFSALREIVKIMIIVAHDMDYQLLVQKVIIPPPEFSFS